jgi:hypothetical protein
VQVGVDSQTTTAVDGDDTLSRGPCAGEERSFFRRKLNIVVAELELDADATNALPCVLA